MLLDANIVPVHNLFDGNKQYLIPVYQRHYVWTKEDQWKPLWQDIIEKVRVNANAVTVSQRKPHFIGTIVTQQLSRHVGDIPGYYIIDGQQRLTTFQIILCAISDACSSAKLKELEDVAEKTDGYLINGGMLRLRTNLNEYRKPDEKYKIIPTQRDKGSFDALVNRTPTNVKGNIQDAYTFFLNEIKQYMDEKREDTRTGMMYLLDTFTSDFKVVDILIDADGDAERIFEAINNRGRTFNEFDHLRNNIFLQARVHPRNFKDFDEKKAHNKHWLHFEDDFWAKKLGMDDREMLESERFLQHFLIAKLKKDRIVHRDLFHTYEKEYRAELPEDREIDFELRELEKYSKIYRIMVDCQYDSSVKSEFHSGRQLKLIAKRMEFYKHLRITSLYPFILFIVNELEIEHSQLDRIFDILESYTMRRLLLCKNRRIPNYSRLFAEVLVSIDKNDWNSVDLVRYLSSLESNEKWPDDNDVRNALAQCGDDSFDRSITRYILYKIEGFKASSVSTLREALKFSNKFTIEHVMPKEWRSNWFKSESLDPDTLKEKDLAKFSIGNLTLLTGESNTGLGNKAFSEKRSALLENLDLKITEEIVCESMSPIRERETWDVAEIRNREEKLWKCFCEELWPDASSFMTWHYGVLKNWHPIFTNGFIIDEEGQEIPVNSSEFQYSDIPTLKKGTKVQFDKVPTDDGFKAINVVKIV